MSANTGIEWTDATWSPLRVRVRENAAEIARQKGYTSLIQIAEKMKGRVGQHCEHVSEGCKRCYSGTWQARCLKVNGTGLPFDRRSRDLIEILDDGPVLDQPLNWKAVRVHEEKCAKTVLGKQAACSCWDRYQFRPRRIFVENQSDLFGEWFEDFQIAQVWAVMAVCYWHTFQVLTKRQERMSKLLASEEFRDEVAMFISVLCEENCDPNERRSDDIRANAPSVQDEEDWPLPNVWLGVSVEDQTTADARIPLLFQTPAAKRFISYEPALGPLDIGDYLGHHLGCSYYDAGFDSQCDCGTLGRLDWVIAGGESGPGARPMHPDWARSTRDQCVAAGVPFFFKQWGENCYWDHLPEATYQAYDAAGYQPQEGPIRVGKKNAGALLDGLEWREFPT